MGMDRIKRRRERQRKQYGRRMAGGFMVTIAAFTMLTGIHLIAKNVNPVRNEQTENFVMADGSDGNFDEDVQNVRIGLESMEDGQNEMQTVPEKSGEANWQLALVNKWNPMEEETVGTLVKVPGGEKVDERIYEPLMEMFEAAKTANWDQMPKVVSGYRTRKTQQKLYEDKIREFEAQGYNGTDAIAMAEQWVAVPGSSEHELGLAVDINGATYDLYFWLQENSYKYGFIFRYPGSKTDITGVSEEVWHYRYVGVEAAAQMYEEGLCLEEYLDRQ